MDFKEYILFFYNNSKFSSQKSFVTKLFEAAGANTYGIEGRVKNWMSGRNNSYRGYFEDIKFDDKGFIGLLKDYANKNWAEIQNEFINKKNILDFRTGNLDILILNQFKHIVEVAYKRNELEVDTTSQLEEWYGLEIVPPKRSLRDIIKTSHPMDLPKNLEEYVRQPLILKEKDKE